jgi:uncharacterized membrane-anchored protein
MIRRIGLWGFALAFAAQAGLLVYMLGARASMLASGTEIRLPVIPVDPRDFLRGDYVILSYPMSRLNAAELEGDNEFNYYAPIFVELAQDGEVWKAAALHATAPEGKTYIRGLVTNSIRPDTCKDTTCNVYDVEYNLEKFFVPEGEGLELEKLRNDQRIQVDVVVGDSGRATLKRLRVDGEVKYEEKMF